MAMWGDVAALVSFNVIKWTAFALMLVGALGYIAELLLDLVMLVVKGNPYNSHEEVTLHFLRLLIRQAAIVLIGAVVLSLAACHRVIGVFSILWFLQMLLLIGLLQAMYLWHLRLERGA